MGNLHGAFIIAAAAYCIIFCSIFIQPGLSLINPVDVVVVKPAAERENTRNLATKSSAPAEEEEKKKPAAVADAGHLLVDPKHKPATDQAKHLSSPPPDNKDDSRPDNQSKSKPKTTPAEQHKHQHKHKKKKEKKEQDCSNKLKPKSETKRDVSPSPSPPPKRSASPKQARESSSPKTITTAPTKATKKLDDQPSKKTPKLSSSSATTHEKP